MRQTDGFPPLLFPPPQKTCVLPGMRQLEHKRSLKASWCVCSQQRWWMGVCSNRCPYTILGGVGLSFLKNCVWTISRERLSFVLCWNLRRKRWLPCACTCSSCLRVLSLTASYFFGGLFFDRGVARLCFLLTFPLLSIVSLDFTFQSTKKKKKKISSWIEPELQQQRKQSQQLPSTSHSTHPAGLITDTFSESFLLLSRSKSPCVHLVVKLTPSVLVSGPPRWLNGPRASETMSPPLVPRTAARFNGPSKQANEIHTNKRMKE